MKRLMIAAILLCSAAAGALTLKEQKKYKEWQEYLTGDSSYRDEVTKKCGYDIPVTMGPEFATPFMAANAHAPSFCDATRSAISGMCEDETSKTVIKKNIKKVDCKLGKVKEAAFKLSGGTLTFTVGVDASNLDDKVKEWLENNLK